MDGHGYLEKACLPERNGKFETLANFSLRVLTSRAPNLLPPGPFVLKKITNGLAVVMVVGEPEGEILVFDAEEVNGTRNVTVRYDLFSLKGDDRSTDRLSGCTGKELIDKSPDLEQALHDRTATLLGEIGLYSGIDITSWWSVRQ